MHINCAYLNGYKIKIDNSEDLDEIKWELSEFKSYIWCKDHGDLNRNYEE